MARIYKTSSIFRYDVCLYNNNFKKIIKMKTYISILLMFVSSLIFSQSIDIINPVEKIGIDNWSIVNDNVMGGISNSDLYITDENNLMFFGNVSLKNNGGFASSRLGFEKGKLKNIKGFKIRLKGDGKKYKFRLRESYRSSNYSTDFDTKSGVWTSIEILVSDLNPMFMGYYSRNTKKLEIENISSLGFQISDKQEGEFKLEIMHVKALY